MDPLHRFFLISLDYIFLYFHVGVPKHPYEEIVLSTTVVVMTTNYLFFWKIMLLML